VHTDDDYTALRVGGAHDASTAAWLLLLQLQLL